MNPQHQARTNGTEPISKEENGALTKDDTLSSPPPRIGPDRGARQEEAVAATIVEARELLASTAGQKRFRGACWEDVSWTHSGGGRRAHTPRSLSLIRPRARSLDRITWAYAQEDALPPAYADLLRSYMVLRTGLRFSALQSFLSALRAFWQFLGTSPTWDPEAWNWAELSDDHLVRFELWLESSPSARGQTYDPSSRRLYLRGLLTFAEWLYARGVCRRIRYVPYTQDPRVERRATEDARTADAVRKLPPDGVMDALADLYFGMISGKVTRDPNIGKKPHKRIPNAVGESATSYDLILISLITLLMLTGRRIGEILSLPVDCEVWQRVKRLTKGVAGVGRIYESPGWLGPPEEGESHEWHYGIRYWAEKTGSKTEKVYWVSPTASPVVQECIERIRSLAAVARARSAVLESSPDAVPLPPHFAEKEWLGRAEILEVVGTITLPQSLRDRGLFPEKGRAGRFYRYSKDLFSSILQGMRKENRVNHHEDGTYQMLSESLFVVFHNASREPRVRPNNLLVHPLTPHDVQIALGAGKTREASLFVKYGTPRQREFWRTNTHAFRHWMTSVAFEGGAPTDLLTDIFGRANPAHTEAYIHDMSAQRARAEGRELTEGDLASELQDGIRAGRYFGPVAITYWTIVYRQGGEAAEEFLLREVQSGHITPWGRCKRDLATKPCEKHLNCLDDCEHYCGTHGDAGEIAALEDLAWKYESQIEDAERRHTGGGRLLPGHLEDTRRKLAGVRRALEWHFLPDVRGGVTQPIFGACALPVLSHPTKG